MFYHVFSCDFLLLLKIVIAQKREIASNDTDVREKKTRCTFCVMFLKFIKSAALPFLLKTLGERKKTELKFILKLHILDLQKIIPWEKRQLALYFHFNKLLFLRYRIVIVIFFYFSLLRHKRQSKESYVFYFYGFL